MKMRKITFGGACSLDGYFARKDHAVDWLMWSDEMAPVMAEYWKTVDTILMGRRTYEVALGHSAGKTNPYAGVKTYVFSRTLNRQIDLELIENKTFSNGCVLVTYRVKR
jgi:dihydrofolate reductase